MTTACEKGGEDGTKEPVLNISTSELKFEASGNASQSVTVTAENVGWEISMSQESQAWITVTVDGNTLTVSVADNDKFEARNGSIAVVPDNSEVDTKRISVSQAAAEAGDLSFTLTPTTLTFDGEGAPAQEVTVTVSDEKLTWTAAPEDAAKEWITVTADGDKFTVTVADNPETTDRSANVIVTPGTESVKAKAVHVTQKGRILPPSLTVDCESGEINFGYKKGFGQNIFVTAVNVDWNVVSSVTADEPGEEVAWLTVSDIVKDEETGLGSFLVIAETNTELEERSGYVIVSADNPDVPNITLKVIQEAGKEFLTTLEGDVEITDMTSGVQNDAWIAPNQTWMDRAAATWDINLYAQGVTVSKEWTGMLQYGGVGTRLVMKLWSERIVYNDDADYTLPDGTYRVLGLDEMDEYGTAPITYEPFTMMPGYETNNLSYPSGSWYMDIIGGETLNEYGGMAPIRSGTVTVTRNGDEYTFVLDLKDDADFSITGTCVTKLDNLSVNFYEQPDPNDPENPDEGDDEEGELPPFGPPSE